MIKKAIIPAAGFGTRCLPITKAVPKELFPVGGKPAIHYIIDEAIEAGIEQILIIISRSKNMIGDYFDRSLELETFLKQKGKHHLLEEIKPPGVQIQYMRQPKAHGLGDAVSLGKSFVGDEPFAVMLPDEVIFEEGIGALSQLLSIYNKGNKSVLGLNKVEQELLSNYGVVDVKGDGKESEPIEVNHIVEKPKERPPSTYAVIGRYIFNPLIFSFLDKTAPSLGGEVQLTDAINIMIKMEGCYGGEITGKRFDISRLEDFIAANQYILQKNKSLKSKRGE